MTRRRAAALSVLLPVVAGGLSACESTADKSARIAVEGKKAVAASATLKIRRSADLRVARAVVVRGEGGAVAVAVEVRNRGARARRDVPVLIDVRDARGTSLYKNDQVGLQPALQRLASVRGRATAWWVNDQVTTTETPRKVSARAGAAPAAAAGSLPRVRLKGVRFETDATGRYLTGTVVNPSRSVLRDVGIFAVALKGAKVVAAGRSLVPRLPAKGSPKTFTFRLFFVGDPHGARIGLTVATNTAPATS